MIYDDLKRDIRDKAGGAMEWINSRDILDYPPGTHHSPMLEESKIQKISLVDKR